MHNKNIVHRRLDYIFVPNTLQEFVTNVDILPSFLSDHSPVLIQVDFFDDGKSGRGFWKFNSKLLTDDSYCEGIKNLISSCLKEPLPSNPHFKWEFLKFEIRKYSIRYSKEREKKI